MITKEERLEELVGLLGAIEDVCERYDLRVGQLMYIVFKDEDIFNVENRDMRERILQDIKGKQC